MAKWVMVLNDGETYTSLDGCAIMAIPEDMPDDEMDHFVKNGDGFYCFDSIPPRELQFTPNNGQTLDDVRRQDYEFWNENKFRLQHWSKGL